MKPSIDIKSLKFKIWAYFALFAALLMIILWFLQIFFLKSYYQEMKIAETGRIAKSIMASYNDNDDYDDYESYDDFVEFVSSVSYKNDMYIHIENGDGDIIFSPNFQGPNVPGNGYLKDLSAIREQLYQSGGDSASIIMNDPRHKNNTLAYCAYLDSKEGEEVLLYIFSPLFPVESTVSILSNQLKYVTVISLILAFSLSFLISRRVSRPISSITSSASKLAQGNYDVTFEGGHYSEIIKLADTLNYTSRELAKADNLQKDLIANVSHDLRTPLTMVKSYAEMIRDLSGDNPDKRNAHLKVIIDEADRLNLLVGDLLVLSKMQSGVDALHLSEFNIKETIESILAPYTFLSEKDGYNISFECESDIFVHGDEVRINQVISNLVNNAIRYSEQEKEIQISLKEENGFVRCQVKDSGQGIPQDELQHIWERYYKSSSNHSRTTSGTGLGLSIVKQILILHHANFGVESKLGEGSTFWFELKK